MIDGRGGAQIDALNWPVVAHDKGHVARFVGRGFGVAAGLVLALMLNKLLTSLLYDVTPTDAVSLTAVALLLIAIAAIAAFIPAAAGARIDPAISLRQDT